MTPPILLVRLRSGVVGESRRVVHVVPCPDVPRIPDVLVAYCGAEIRAGVAELLPRPCGMPCTACLISAPLPASAPVPAGD
ncbi:hypothetical protein [Gandjariella thermophila]|uniref:Uncharacterized protein n=1 Tax=Gandjariella thermophila TaxID=1931992 RepID=A0A4D4J677_9PSEU|nr:hypothetical protein [Gandjariella thermophila]GDY30089.1 hypothetical protein GTS_17220 [Gandjariella thermophila]